MAPLGSSLPRGAPEDPWVIAGLVIVGLIVGVAMAVWAIAQLAAILFGGGSLESGLADMPGVLNRLPSQLSDPAAAWPTPDRQRLPGPVGVYGALAIAVGALTTLGVATAKVVGRVRDRRPGGRRAEAGGARWGRARDLRMLLVSTPEPGRLVLGRLGRHLVATEPRASTIVIGPSQSGKTAGLAIPAILEAAGPVVAVSVKRDLLDHTLTARRRRGAVWIYDPTGAARLEDPDLVGWDPVKGCTSWAGARQVAHALTSAHGLNGRRDTEFWLPMARKLLAPLLLAAAKKEGSMRDVVRWLDTQEHKAVKGRLEDSGAEDASLAFEASCRREEKLKSNVYSTAEAILESFADPEVLASTDSHGIDPQAILNGRNTLYIVAPAKDQERLSPLFAGLVEHVIDATYARAAAGKPCDPPLLLVLDEAANTAPIRNLPQLAATAGGQGIQVVTVFQDLAQARSRYGDAADTILANHRAKLFLSGISDGRTLEYLGRGLGDEEVAHESRTDGRYGGPTRTQGTRSRLLAPADRVRGIPPGEALLVYGHLPPARLALRPWFSEPGLRQLARPQDPP